MVDTTVIIAIIISTVVALVIVALVVLLFYYHWRNQELLVNFSAFIRENLKLKDAIDKAGEVVPLEQLENEHVRKVLNKCDGNMKKAADLLGISRQTLYNKVKN